MMSVSQNGTLAELIAALLPCMWSYWEIGKRLNDIPGARDHGSLVSGFKDIVRKNTVIFVFG